MAQAIPAIIAGFITSISINLPTILAAVITFIAWLIFKFVFLGKKNEQEQST